MSPSERKYSDMIRRSLTSQSGRRRARARLPRVEVVAHVLDLAVEVLAPRAGDVRARQEFGSDHRMPNPLVAVVEERVHGGVGDVADIDAVQSHAAERCGVDPGFERPSQPQVVLEIVVRLDRGPRHAAGLERGEDLHLAREVGNVGRRVRAVRGMEDDPLDAGLCGRIDGPDPELRLPRVERREEVNARHAFERRREGVGPLQVALHEFDPRLRPAGPVRRARQAPDRYAAGHQALDDPAPDGPRPAYAKHIRHPRLLSPRGSVRFRRYVALGGEASTARHSPAARRDPAACLPRAS